MPSPPMELQAERLSASAPMNNLAFMSAPRDHLADERRVRRRRLHVQIMRQCGPTFHLAVGLDQAEAMPAPGFGRRIRILRGDGITLRGAGIVAGAVAQTPDLRLIVTQQAVPSVLGQSLDEILAGTGVVEPDLVVEQ